MQILFRILYYFTAISYLIGCQSPATVESETRPNPSTSEVYQPALALGDFFHEVQMSEIFPDSKTFVDCKPRVPLMEIRSAYDQQNKNGSVDLKGLVEQYFEIPLAKDKPVFKSQKNMVDHLNSLWPSLTRNPDDQNGVSSLLPLPYPYVVPGGRFREIYYWDSYFTMLGLLESQKDSLVLNMIRNFGYLIDTYGFIPNGNRSYYLGRSQPPFFSSMVMLWANRHGPEAALQFLPQMRLEYDFWMQGKELLLENNSSNGRLVRLPDGTILNRYWDSFTQPRPESYKEDYELGESFPENQRERVYRDLRAGAESGWDYSSRWFSDGESLDSIITTKIIPVDLNCLLYFLECSIAKLSLQAGDTSMANFFKTQSANRAFSIRKYFWDPNTKYFSDYNIETGKTTVQFSAAGMVPLYFQIATADQARQAINFMKENLLYPGGIVSSTHNTGQQWDFPNGWAPQQWMAIQGLRNYQYYELADDVSSRWLTITEKVFNNTGKMMEKYNVVDLTLSAGGGEYPTQDGFGWTNGVTLALWWSLENPSNSDTQ